MSVDGDVETSAAVASPGNNGSVHSRDPSSWYAITTTPRHEKKALSHLQSLGLEVILPTYTSTRTWKNRQRKEVILPLFPTYLFVRIAQAQRVHVLSTPGVRSIVGNSREMLPIADGEIETLRRTLDYGPEPFAGLLVGQRVRIMRGPLEGLEGSLIRHNNSARIVITVKLIQQHASVEVDLSAVTPISS